MKIRIISVPNSRNAAKWHSTGGPLYPFSFSKEPLPSVRYADGGPFGWIKNLFSPKDSVATEEVEVQRPEPQGLNYNELRMRQAYAESRFDNSAKSKAGAVGMFQIVPGVLTDYNNANGTSYTMEDLTDQATNTTVRDWYMTKLLGRPWVTKGGANDSVQFAKGLAAYNYGPTAALTKLNEAKQAGVDIYNGWDWLSYMPTETRDYVNFILRGQNNSMHRNDTAYKLAQKLKSEEVKKLQ